MAEKNISHNDDDDSSGGIDSLIPLDRADEFDRNLRQTEKSVTDGALEKNYAKNKTDRSYEVENRQEAEAGAELSTTSGLEEHPVVKFSGVNPKNLTHATSENTASLDELEGKPRNELSPELQHALEQKLSQKKEKTFNPEPAPL